MSRSAVRSLVAGAAVVVVAGVVAQVTAPSGALPAPDVVRVVSTGLVCPDAHTPKDSSALAQLSVVTPRTLDPGPTGRAVVGSTTSPRSLATLTGPVYGVVRTVPSGTGPVVGNAVAGRAPGFTMDQLTVSTRRFDYGLSGVTCPEPTSETWFVGTGSDVGHSSTLYLSNPEATPATVDIALYGRNGRVDAPAGLGLQVSGRSSLPVKLDRLAPRAGALAVRISVLSGRVAASVLDSQVRGLIPQGADWLPVAAAPATRVVVPGLVGGAGTRRLSVYAPGEGTATVHVRLVGEQGTFAPAGAASFDIDRGRLTTVDLGTAIAGDNAAAVVDADVPIVAGVRWALTGGTFQELALSAGTPALTGAAVVAGNRVDFGYRTALVLTALGGPRTVRVQPLVAGVPFGNPVVVSVGGDRTKRLQMPSNGAHGSFQVVITPVAGPGALYAGVYRQKTVGQAVGATIATVRDARIDVAVPDARPNLDVGLGR